MKLSDGMQLYHGSYADIERIDLAKCMPGKDFGAGFYLTSDIEQARRFIPSSVRKAQAQNRASIDQDFGFVTTFTFHWPKDPIAIYEFERADRNWLRFIALNRRSLLAQQFYEQLDPALRDPDIIIGKVANDTTNPTITAYLTGIFGSLDDDKTIDAVIERLMPDKLTDQYCFATPAALSRLERTKADRYEF